MLRFTLQLTQIPTGGTGIVNRVRQRFQLEAGTLVLDAIRAHLGTDIYTLSPAYAAAKPRRKGFRRFPGKSSAQPLILSGEGIYNALTAIPDGDGIRIEVQDGLGLSPEGFDYSEFWEQVTHFLERGLDDVESKLDELLGTIIAEEMML